jgi:SAM-dependent methyltransferase
MISPIKHEGPVLDRADGIDVIECSTCGFKHVLPLPTAEELSVLYGDQFYSHEKPKYLTNAEEDKDWWMLTYAAWYALLEKHMQGRRLLDVGSGPGYFLDAGKSRGWETLGFEPSKEAAEYSRKRGLAVVADFFTAEKVRDQAPFDAVALSLVLEHVPDPIALLEDARRVLSPGGLLFVVVPNDYNPLQKILREQRGFAPWWVSPKHHLNYFNFESLPRALARAGFETLELEAAYPMELFLLGGRNYVGNDEVGRACHKERKEFETALYRSNPALLARIYHAFAQEGLGRQVIAVARVRT